MIDVDAAGQKLQALAPPDELLQFARALIEAGAFVVSPGAGDPLREFVYFLEKPWKWSALFVAWDAAGRPLDGSEQGWDAFYAAASE